MKINFSLSGIGIILGIVFIILKLCGVITWSWFLVTMPFWLGIVISIVLVIILALIAYVVKKRE